jgi:predicted dehydrogenase
MPKSKIRIGVIGAGKITRERHLPRFAAIPGVEISAVCNLSAESTQRVADAFDIPTCHTRWRDVIDDERVDAVLIGAWPSLHCEATCAALEAGKHVLTQARMAMNLDEAQRMLATAERHRSLVAQIVPSPYGLLCGPAVTRLIDDGFLGTLRELVVIGVDNSMWDYSRPLHWRQEESKSGRNVLSLGILHETVLRWTAQPTQVFAQSKVFEPARPVPEQCRVAEVNVPDSVQVLTQLPDGGRGIYHLSGVTLFGPGKQIHLYGSRGTIRLIFHPDGREQVSVGYACDSELQDVTIPDEQLGRWRVEEDFVRSIQTGEPPRLTDFASGVEYMEFVEAVARSAERNAAVTLPLAN